MGKLLARANEAHPDAGTFSLYLSLSLPPSLPLPFDLFLIIIVQVSVIRVSVVRVSVVWVKKNDIRYQKMVKNDVRSQEKSGKWCAITTWNSSILTCLPHVERALRGYLTCRISRSSLMLYAYLYVSFAGLFCVYTPEPNRQARSCYRH